MLTPLKQDAFDKVYAIMEESFPFDEIRSHKKQKELLCNSNYKIATIGENGEIHGFIAVWDFENFVFLEHFAISSKCRGKGLGHTILRTLDQYTDKKIILEVEHPTDDVTKRRIAFYERNGFSLFDFGYIMPPYSKKHKPVPLCLMSTATLTQADFEDFYDKIVHVVNV